MILSLLADAWHGKPLHLRSPHWYKVEHNHLLKYPSCALCGGTVKLQVHHVLPFHLFPEFELEPCNLLTLCMANKCHYVYGHGRDWKAYIPTVKALLVCGDIEYIVSNRVYVRGTPESDYISNRLRQGLPI